MFVDHDIMLFIVRRTQTDVLKECDILGLYSVYGKRQFIWNRKWWKMYKIEEKKNGNICFTLLAIIEMVWKRYWIVRLCHELFYAHILEVIWNDIWWRWYAIKAQKLIKSKTISDDSFVCLHFLILSNLWNPSLLLIFISTNQFIFKVYSFWTTIKTINSLKTIFYNRIIGNRIKLSWNNENVFMGTQEMIK